ncbi:cupredoxin domain-containing protein [Kitasatospora sp. NPDC049285]|uniref:cupredoxin domain-containing protein n=1 Tax=Kitasatospora sp. NPDC049285 TaxID=3157096 RepID=UPI003419DCB0
MRSPRALPVLAAALLALPLVAACGGNGKTASSSADAGKVAINATDTACEIAGTDFQAGDVTFAIHNKGGRATEVYVYGEQKDTFTKVVTEVENIGPGTSRDMPVKLAPGTYEIACKPGQTGDGIRKRITVQGDAAGPSAATGSPAASPTGSPTASAAASATAQPSPSVSAAPDREVEVEAKEYELEFDGMDKLAAKVGERIAFTLENKGSVEHELEVFGPDGKEIGEVAPVGRGQKGEAVVTLTVPGTYTLKCGLGTHADKGMTATFTVN